MERIGIRELRNNAARAVRRAMGGERIVITVNGTPTAQLGPLTTDTGGASLDDLVAAGRLERPRTQTPPRRPRPMRAPSPRSSGEVLDEQRGR